jgi:histidine ammonia-lyase
VVDEYAHRDEPTYGINTGLRQLRRGEDSSDQLDTLQINLLRSHAAGVGDALAFRVVARRWRLRANVLAKGFSGIRVETLELLIEMLNRRRAPARAVARVGGRQRRPGAARASRTGPDRGGRGGWGDGRAGWVSGADALRQRRASTHHASRKEGLALINGTQPSTALLGMTLAGAERLARVADVAAAMSIDGLQGSTRPFDRRIHDARGFTGQSISAANLLTLLDGSGINAAHANCGRVQDAYSMRCAPQVHGAARDAFGFARRTFDIEANAATDNPMVFAATRDIVSGGNFHGAPVALACDVICSGSSSWRRSASEGANGSSIPRSAGCRRS